MKSTLEQIQQFLEVEFPQSLEHCEVINVQPQNSTVRYRVRDSQLRPGGTVSGPTIMTIADFGLYVAILGEIGLIGLAVTTNININFLRKPDGQHDLIGKCRLIKVGKALIVGEVWVYSEGMEEPVAHVTGTYSIPPKSVS
ncbi:PaaI family thioesterase [Acinetobacter schindleri]|uniref:PaaI family thioesterase n=1 Tax=Acinetobacter schindleri TaxID=108981 RepID=UPI003D06A5AC